MDELDVAVGFASLAADMKFVRPSLDERYTRLLITQGGGAEDSSPAHTIMSPMGVIRRLKWAC